jgi:hypothetical protein
MRLALPPDLPGRAEEKVAPRKAVCRERLVLMMLEFEYLVFYSQLLALEIGDRRGIRQRTTDFLVDLIFDMCVPGTERFDTILKHERLQS